MLQTLQRQLSPCDHAPGNVTHLHTWWDTTCGGNKTGRGGWELGPHGQLPPALLVLVSSLRETAPGTRKNSSNFSSTYWLFFPFCPQKDSYCHP